MAGTILENPTYKKGIKLKSIPEKHFAESRVRSRVQFRDYHAAIKSTFVDVREAQRKLRATHGTRVTKYTRQLGKEVVVRTSVAEVVSSLSIQSRRLVFFFSKQGIRDVDLRKMGHSGPRGNMLLLTLVVLLGSSALGVEGAKFTGTIKKPVSWAFLGK